MKCELCKKNPVRYRHGKEELTRSDDYYFCQVCSANESVHFDYVEWLPDTVLEMLDVEPNGHYCERCSGPASVLVADWRDFDGDRWWLCWDCKENDPSLSVIKHKDGSIPAVDAEYAELECELLSAGTESSPQPRTEEEIAVIPFKRKEANND